MARDWIHWGDNSTEGLPIDEMMIDQIRTRSSDSYATDSSSSATAYSCGVKTYNGVFPSLQAVLGVCYLWEGVAVNDDQEPCGTVLEAAKLKGFMTRLIVASRITHVRPLA